jgi:ubiquinone/menaquinone biosynthesis C-methylase UbiE
LDSPALALMEYLPTPAATGAGKYHGAIAQGYDAKRVNDPKWTIEQAHIEDMLDDLPKGSWVLDVPCGTGRFFECYHRKGFLFHAVDRSEDMLKEAWAKVGDPHKARLHVGDVRDLSALEDKSVDAALMIRLSRWLSPNDCVVALKELQRVSRQKIISTWRVRNHPHARSYALINSALDGWKIHRDEQGSDPDYRIIELRPV